MRDAPSISEPRITISVTWHLYNQVFVRWLCMFVFLSRSMLGRIVTRPAATLRPGSQLQRRFIHPSRPQLEALPRPNTWVAKIRFRADGKPRSKIIALGFGEYPLINFFSILFWRKKLILYLKALLFCLTCYCYVPYSSGLSIKRKPRFLWRG